MRVRQSLLGSVLLSGLLLFGFGCQSGMSDDRREDTRELVVFVSETVPQVRQRAEFYGLKTKVIDKDSATSQLLQAMLGSPTDSFYVVINPALNRYIASQAMPSDVNPVTFDQEFRMLRRVSKTGQNQIQRLYPENKEQARLMVFSDFECPYCRDMEVILKEWQEHYGDRLDIQMVHFPLPRHKHAFAAAEASECARRQGKFDEYRDMLFENQSDLQYELFNTYARKLGLDRAAFKQCLSLHQTRLKVRQDQYLGRYIGVRATPTLLLNGNVLVGDPLMMQQQIEKVLGTREDPAGGSAKVDESGKPADSH